MLRHAALLSATLLLSGCFDRPAATWVRQDGRLNDLPAQRVASRPDLIECIKLNDPAHLSMLDHGGDYRPGSWAVTAAQALGVETCMSGRGWAAFPDDLL